MHDLDGVSVVFCFRDGTLAHWVTHSVCVCGCGHTLCAYIKITFRLHHARYSLAGQTRVGQVRVWPERDYTLGTAVTALLCGCSVVKLNFCFRVTRSHLDFGYCMD